MKIIFVGYAVSEDAAETLSGISVAGNKMQLNVLKYIGVEFEQVFSTTVFPVSSFPNDKKIYYEKKIDHIVGDVFSTRISFINLPGIKQLNQIVGNYRQIKKIIDMNPDSMLLTFNMYPQIGIPAVWIKKKYGNKIACILADLPIDDDYGRRGIKKLIRELFNEITRRNIREIDKAIVLNKVAWERYCPQAECLVVEGGVDVQNDEEKDEDVVFLKEPSRKNLLYCGSLNEYSGIRELVDAMEFVDSNEVELDIYGDGKLREYVQKNTNLNVHYCGVVRNTEILKKQYEAWALVNPRPIDDKIAQVTFPSKIFEYLNSGTPVITTRLNGFTHEYDDVCIFIESCDPRGIADCINRICGYDYELLRDIGKRARQFVREKKNWKSQTKRIAEFIKN